jgi:phage baseplate assembly protein W
MHFDPEFGCTIWEMEFSDLYTTNKANIRAALRNSIDKFEKRLYSVSVDFAPVDDQGGRALGMQVRVSGNYRDEGKEKKFDGVFTIG